MLKTAKNYIRKGNKLMFAQNKPEKAIEYYNMAYALLPYESSVRLVRECCLQKLSRSDDSWEVWDNIEALALFEPITLSPSSKK
jgi:hypothetical protein